MSPFELRELVDSTIFDYSRTHGEKYIRDHIQHIYLGTDFYLYLRQFLQINRFWIYGFVNQRTRSKTIK